MSTKLTNENFVPTKFNKKKDKEREKTGPNDVRKMLKKLKDCKENANCKEKVKKELRKIYAKKCYNNKKTQNTSACKMAKDKTATKKGYKFHPVYGNLRY